MLATLERARHPASSLSRLSRRGRDRCERSESRRGLQPAGRRSRRGSLRRKSLQAPGLCCIRAQTRGGENIIEQINNSTGTVLYLHHDQQGSTRLLTGSTGKTEASFTYDAYGNQTGHTGTATTPLGYDGQYTSSDTGLVYLRNRVYDPTTAQFLSVDPAVALTREPYPYGGDNPVNRRDPDGLSAEGLEGVPCYWPLCGPPPPAVEGVQHGIETVEHGIEGVWNAVNENEGPNDEGEAELREKEAQRESCGNPAEPPGPGWEWKGKGPVGSNEGSWFNPENDESLHPDLDNEEHGPHYDYKAPDKSRWRIYPDGRIEPQL
jgi:RHS repeat-associated protein